MTQYRKKPVVITASHSAEVSTAAGTMQSLRKHKDEL